MCVVVPKLNAEQYIVNPGHNFDILYNVGRYRYETHRRGSSGKAGIEFAAIVDQTSTISLSRPKTCRCHIACVSEYDTG